MSWAISRIRLSQIGPATARFEGFLDLRGADSAPGSAVALRLVNQGGKGVLLQHLLNLLVPGQRGIIGEKETLAKLGKFVLGGDLAHLAVEWRRGDELLVTGKTMRWRHEHPSADNSDLIVHFYCFRPDGLTLDNLPFARDGRRLRHQDFHRVLADALTDHARGEHDLVHTTDQRKWTKALRDRGIDSDLFRYQVRMNHQEGGADQLLTSLKTNDAFLRFFVDILAEDDDLARLTAMVSAQRASLVRREVVAAEARLFRELAQTGASLGELAHARKRAQKRLGHSRREAQLLWLALTCTRSAANERLPELEERRRETQLQATTARREQATARLQSAEARVRAAELESEHAADAAAEHEQAVDDRERTWEAWRAAGPIAEAADARARLEAITSALERLDRNSEPLRRLAEEAGERLYRALSATLKALDAQIRDLNRRVAIAAGKEKDARKEADASAQEAAGLQQRLVAARQEHTRHQRARDVLARDGILAAGVLAADQLAAVTDEHQRRATALTALRERLSDARDRARRTGEKHQTTLRASEQVTARAERTRDRLKALEAEVTEVASLEGVAAALGQRDGAAQLWKDRDGAAVRLAENEARAQLRLARLLAEEHAEREVIEQIAAGHPGLIPPDQDCRQVLEHLAARKVPAASGWRYVHDARSPELWSESLKRCGALAAAVVLVAADADTADTLVEELAAQLPGLRRTVPVCTSEEFEALLDGQAPGAASRRVVDAGPGMVDPAAAEQHRAALDESLQGAAESRAKHEDEMRHATQLRLACTALWERHPADPRPAARLDAERAEQERAEADRQVELARRANAQAAEDLAGLEQRATTDERHLADLRLTRVRLEPVAADELRLAADEHDPTKLGLLRSAQIERRDAALADEENARLSIRVLDEECRAMMEDRRARVDERARITLRANGSAADPPSQLQPTRAVFAAALERWQAASTDEELVAERHAAEAALSDAQRRRDKFSADVLAAAAGLMSSGRYDAERRQDGEDRAHKLLTEARQALGGALKLHEQAQQAHATAGDARDELEAELAAAGVKRMLDPDERFSYASIDEARAGAQAAAERAADADRRRSRAASQEARLREDVAQVRQRAETCRRLLGRLPEHPDPTADADVLTDDSDELDRMVELAERQHREADDEIQDVKRRLSDVARALRQIARSESWPDEAGRTLRQTLLAHDELLELADWATGALDGIAARAAACDEELRELDERTGGLVEFFTQLTARCCALLRRLASVSRMPEGLGGWTGRSFITASVPTRPTDAALRDRVERTLKAALESEQDSRLRGADLLFRAIVAACEGRAPAIRFLKPDIGLPHQRVALGEGMSGGQGVTAAVALYCALANLRREAVAAQLTASGGGTLLLDNPFGKTTSPELLSIMFRVARRLGVQLVCLTPSTEDAVVAQFPVLLQLRNSRGVRDGLRHVRLQEVEHRETLAQADGNVSAVRLTRQDP